MAIRSGNRYDRIGIYIGIGNGWGLPVAAKVVVVTLLNFAAMGTLAEFAFVAMAAHFAGVAWLAFAPFGVMLCDVWGRRLLVHTYRSSCYIGLSKDWIISDTLSRQWARFGI